jgi:hypothetical protein
MPTRRQAVDGRRRIGHQRRVVGQGGLAVEHRHDVAVDIRAERHLGVLPAHQLAGRNLGAVFHEQVVGDHLADLLLMDDGHVGVPDRLVRLLLRLEPLEDLLRTSIPRPGSDGPHRIARILLFK